MTLAFCDQLPVIDKIWMSKLSGTVFSSLSLDQLSPSLLEIMAKNKLYLLYTWDGVLVTTRLISIVSKPIKVVDVVVVIVVVVFVPKKRSKKL